MSKNKAGAKALGAIVLSIIPVFLLGCGSASQGTTPGSPLADPGERQASSAIAVTTVRASLGSIAKTLDTGGEVVAEYQVNAFADIAGQVTAVPIEVGDTVRKGQRIAVVDPSTPGREYAESLVEAPISGTVTALPLRVGDKISSSTAVATIGRLDALEIEVRVPERFIGQVRMGTSASCSFAAWPGEAFPARVVELSPVVDSTSRTLKATLALDRPDGRVKAGMYATVALILAKKTGVLTLPADCVVSRDGQNRKDVVFVVEEDRAVQRAVSLGISAAGMMEITGGISEGERIVASGQSLLADGAQVRIVAETESKE
jgi:multidrug efflux pump subunit AcrA (membrane-fusion protein)